MKTIISSIVTHPWDRLGLFQVLGVHGVEAAHVGSGGWGPEEEAGRVHAITVVDHTRDVAARSALHPHRDGELALVSVVPPGEKMGQAYRFGLYRRLICPQKIPFCSIKISNDLEMLL